MLSRVLLVPPVSSAGSTMRTKLKQNGTFSLVAASVPAVSVAVQRAVGRGLVRAVGNSCGRVGPGSRFSGIISR